MLPFFIPCFTPASSRHLSLEKAAGVLNDATQAKSIDRKSPFDENVAGLRSRLQHSDPTSMAIELLSQKPEFFHRFYSTLSKDGASYITALEAAEDEVADVSLRERLSFSLRSLMCTGWRETHEKTVDKATLLNEKLNEKLNDQPKLQKVDSHWTNHENLATYLLMRALRNGKIDDISDINELKFADACQNQARRTLHYGRSNVDLDLKKNNAAYARMEAGRRLEGELPKSHNADFYALNTFVNRQAASAMAQAGNCSEHAYQAAASILHSSQHMENFFDNPSSVTFGIAKANKLDHEWVSLNGKKNSIYIDPWQYGPAIFKEDARLNADITAFPLRVNSKESETVIGYLADRQKMVDAKSKSYEEHLRDVNSKGLKQEKVWLASEVIDRTKFPTRDDKMIEQNAHAFAVSILVALGASSSEAARAAPIIVREVKNENGTFIR